MRSAECTRAINHALKLIQEESNVYDTSVALTSSERALSFWRLRLEGLEDEQFDVVYLNNQHEIIACETLFKGTISSTSVYPRTVLKRVLHLNAAAIVLAHNHPSGISTPSQSDRNMTNRLVEACKLIDVSVLDHIIVGKDCYSFADHGLI